MRILFFSPYFYPYTSGLTVYPLRILKNLTKKNEVTVLTFIHQKDLAKEEEIHKNKNKEVLQLKEVRNLLKKNRRLI